MGKRSDLQMELCKLLGTKNVYFQPPSTIQMKYPAIVYSLSSIENRHANNNVYAQRASYTATLITPNKDDEVIAKLSQRIMCRFDRQYVKDNLYHNVFTLYL